MSKQEAAKVEQMSSSYGRDEANDPNVDLMGLASVLPQGNRGGIVGWNTPRQVISSYQHTLLLNKVLSGHFTWI